MKKTLLYHYKELNSSESMEVFKKSEAVQPFFKSAHGYAVFPTIGKGGIGIGGAYGKGRVYRKGQMTGETSLIKATFDKPGRYVWHCHILSHEDHEMMRVLHVGPGA